MTQLLISPSGVLTNVPDNQAEDALKDGFKAAPTESSPDKVYGVSPTGVLTELHPDEAKQAFKDGFTPFEDILRKQNEISQARAKGEAGQEVLPGDENKNRFPFARAADQIKNFVTGDKPIPANFNLQDENGNYHLLDQDKNPILISHDKVTDYLIQNPTAEFQDPQLQTAYLARLQEASESKSEESKTAAAEQGFLNKKVWGVIPTVYDDYVSDPSVSPGHKLSLIASKVADTTGATGTLGEKLAYEGAGAALDILTNPLPRIVGKAAGEILPKAATLLGRVGRGAAIGAAEGAAFSTPQAIAQATLDKDPAGAAETLAFNTLGGGFLGGAMQGAGEIGAALHNLPVSETLKNSIAAASDNVLFKALNLNKNEIESFAPTPELRAQKLKAIIDHVGLDNIKSTSQFKKAVLNIADDVGPEIGNTIKTLDKVVEESKLNEFLPDVNNIRQRLEELREDVSEGPYGKPKHKLIDDAISETEAMAKPNAEGAADKLSFDDAQKLKKTFQGDANYRTTDSDSLNFLRKKIAFIARDEFDKAAENVANKSGNVKLAKDWTDYKNLYGISKSLENPLTRLTKSSDELLSFGNMISGSLGHAAGAAIGLPSPLGSIAGIAGKKLLQHWLHENGLTKIGTTLKKLSDSIHVGSYVAMDAAQILNHQLAQIPKVISREAIKENNPFQSNPDQIKYMLGKEANGLTKEQQFDRLSNHLSDMVSNPQIMTQQVKTIAAPVAHFHPEVGQMFEDNLNKTVKYIYDNMPKNPKGPQPFTKEGKWTPSKSQLDDFNKLLAVANNPFSVIDSLKKGTLTTKEVATLSVLNPAILSRMQDEIYKIAYSGKAELTYQQRLSASLLMGQDMNAQLDKVHQMQSVYGPTQQASAPAPPPKQKGKGTTKGFNNIDKMPGATYSQAQRLSK